MTPGEVFRLIFLELVGFSVIGAALGFVSMRLFLAVFAYAVTKVPFLTALRLTGAALVRTAVLTLATVLVFGVGPALSAARASTMEVLRSE
jgi:ABC-type antimicrobial peptide transport system permease subunit